MDWQSRTTKLLGAEAVAGLAGSRVAVAGVGGVGSAAVEMLCRAGIGHLTLIDGDTVNETNLNRQLVATVPALGQLKTEAAKARCLQINPEAVIETYPIFLDDTQNDKQMLDGCDYVIDAIDSVASKIALIRYCLEHGIRIVSSMGAAGRLDPSKIQFADISKTHTCPLARTVRSKLREIGINSGLDVVFSTEPANSAALNNNGDRAFGTISYIPVIFGCFAAFAVITKLGSRVN